MATLSLRRYAEQSQLVLIDLQERLLPLIRQQTQLVASNRFLIVNAMISLAVDFGSLTLIHG